VPKPACSRYRPAQAGEPAAPARCSCSSGSARFAEPSPWTTSGPLVQAVDRAAHWRQKTAVAAAAVELHQRLLAAVEPRTEAARVTAEDRPARRHIVAHVDTVDASGRSSTQRSRTTTRIPATALW
jgi:hypothetical protein